MNILNCPFCGEKPFVQTVHADGLMENIRCSNPKCSAMVMGPAELWNRRSDVRSIEDILEQSACQQIAAVDWWSTLYATMEDQPCPGDK